MVLIPTSTSPTSGPPRRRGVVLVVVGALILLVGAGAVLIQRFMQAQYLEAHRYTFGEIAVNLAESGLNLFMEHLRESGLTPGSPLYEILVASAWDELDGTVYPVASPHLDELVALAGAGARASVQVEFRGFKPFYPPGGLKGVEPDPREKFGELAIVARGEYRGLVRTLVAAKQVKVASVVAPVLSKFTLFVRSRDGVEPNLLAYDRTRPARGFAKDGEPAHPLVLYHSPERNPAVVDDRFFSLAAHFSTYPPDRGGLVYLGGASPWYLNLVHGAGPAPHEESHLLRRTRYRMDSALPGIRTEYGLAFGFYQGILASGKFGSQAAPSTPTRRTGEPVPDATAAIHLYGDLDDVTPTLVFGPVFRSYVTLRLLDGLWYPFRTPAEFQGVAATSPVFAGGYEAYRRVMVRVEDEPVNRTLDYLASNAETLLEDGRVDAEETPFVPEPGLLDPLLTRVGPAVDGDPGFLRPRPGEPVPGALRLLRPRPGGRPDELFRGALQDLDGPTLEKLLAPKVAVVVKDQAELTRRYLAGTRLELPGIVRVEEGDVELPALASPSGGMLVVSGTLRLMGPITGPAKGPPLTLVSLGGDIHVATGEPVRAHLVALDGWVRTRGRLQLVGALAAGNLDLAGLVAGPEPKAIRYDPALDPTDAEAQRAQLRVALDRRVKLYLEGH